MNEVYNLIVGKKICNKYIGFGVNSNEGNPVQVSFRYEDVIKYEDSLLDVIGFYHTHPNFQAYPSSTDVKTMRGWVSCLGRPLLCVIEGVDSCNFWWMKQDGSSFEMLFGRKFGNIFAGNMLNVK